MNLQFTHARVGAPEITGADGVTRPRPPETLLDLVRDLRAVEPASRWFFHWTEVAERPVIDLWAGVPAALSPEFSGHLANLLEPIGVPPENSPTPGEFPSIEFDDDVAMASSELALAVAGESALDYRTQLVLAVWHLRHVVALIEESGRRGFLFRCWQHHTARLTPAQRTELCARSADGADVLREGLPAMGPDTERGWDGYLRTLRRNARAWAAEGAPVNYLLFEHAHLTLRRLRVPPSVEALAARTVRLSLTPSGTDPGPLAVPGAVLSTV
ncbi:hypothetical protein [Streptomyces sp. SID13726]|uniref:hypothetical protein n=1 Tax=Streptomyces sp. SID13726 TaxID=2706058 RepID=UPI0013B774E8|nr:hypothetical protein [Streptomyces sp. SID13726]NEB02412.1 hypothetical protein [Streptomyces sp. SID13726]